MQRATLLLSTLLTQDPNPNALPGCHVTASDKTWPGASIQYDAGHLDGHIAKPLVGLKSGALHDVTAFEGHIFKDEEQAINIAVTFWRSHDVVRHIQALVPNGESFNQNTFDAIYRSANRRTELGENTFRSYATRTLGWLRGLGIVAQIGNTLLLQDPSKNLLSSLSEVSSKRIRQSDFFLGEAPPTKVVEAFRAICGQPMSRFEIESIHGRNTSYVLVKLGLIKPDGTNLVKASTAEAEQIIAERALASPTVRAAAELAKTQGNLSGLDYGRYLSQKFGTQWSTGSQKRYGTALRQWAEWSAANYPVRLN